MRLIYVGMFSLLAYKTCCIRLQILSHIHGTYSLISVLNAKQRISNNLEVSDERIETRFFYFMNSSRAYNHTTDYTTVIPCLTFNGLLDGVKRQQYCSNSVTISNDICVIPALYHVEAGHVSKSSVTVNLHTVCVCVRGIVELSGLIYTSVNQCQYNTYIFSDCFVSSLQQINSLFVVNRETLEVH